MPVYEYQCQDCGTQFEELQSISDKPLKKCKNCGGSVQRLISQSSFSLKGGGWYKDGYSSSKAPEKTASPSKSSGSGSKGPAKDS